MSTAPISLVLDRVEGKYGTSARRNGSGWSAKCPAHDDNTPSLTITEGDDGRALVHCHAGCDTNAILDGLGLVAADLFPTPLTTGDRSTIVATYDYVDEAGELLFQAVRFSPKQFRQRRPDGKGGWIWKLDDTRRVPYRLPELLEAAAGGAEILVTEGEKDCDAARSAGAVATCNPMGAGKWRPEFAEHFRGAGLVAVVADRDDAGRAHASAVADSLRSIGVDVIVLEPKMGKDLADHLTAGLALDDLQELDETTMPPTSIVDIDDDELAEWQRIDLGPALRGELPEIAPDVGHRDDGKSFLYRKHVNGIHSDSGVGKGWIAAIFTVQEITAGRDVAWVSFEDPDERLVTSRLIELGADPADIEKRVHYYAPPSTPFTADAVGLVVREVLEHEISLVVVDSLGEAFGLEGINEDKDVEVNPWMRRVARPLADAGAAVMLIDHATKAADNPLHPSGSKRKRAAITGASYLVEAPQSLTKEKGGRLKLTCAKDRHGHWGRGDVVAEIAFTIYPDGGMTVHVWPPSIRDQATSTPEGKLDVIARAAIRAAKKNNDHPLSQRELLALMSVKARDEDKKAGIERAVARGALRADRGARGAMLHSYVRNLDDPDLETTE